MSESALLNKYNEFVMKPLFTHKTMGKYLKQLIVPLLEGSYCGIKAKGAFCLWFCCMYTVLYTVLLFSEHQLSKK